MEGIRGVERTRCAFGLAFENERVRQWHSSCVSSLTRRIGFNRVRRETQQRHDGLERGEAFRASCVPSRVNEEPFKEYPRMVPRRIVLSAAFATVFLASAWVSAAKPLTFRVYEDARDEVLFISQAPLEKITGKATKTRGEVTVDDLSDLMRAKIAASFEVDLATIGTGLPLRDQHMRDMYLEVKKYPKAVFTFEKVERVQVVTKDAQGNAQARTVKGLTPGVPTTVALSGTFEVHGVKKPVRIPGLLVTYLPESAETRKLRPGDLLRIEGGFTIKLADYAIKRPQFVLMKLAEDVAISVALTAGTGVVDPSKQTSRGVQ
jgi:polyisoprenoid-binding protein YceI